MQRFQCRCWQKVEQNLYLNIISFKIRIRKLWEKIDLPSEEKTRFSGKKSEMSSENN